MLQLKQPAKKSNLPKDDLLRLLFEGVAAHYAADYQRSASAFDRASLLAEDRSTKSISRAALSVMVNDFSLAYEPSRTERLLLPYYAALTYTQAGNGIDAAVEARRLSALLQSLQDRGAAPDKHFSAFLHYFAGVIFEATGNRVDAAVSYRNAYTLDGPALPPFTGTRDSLGDVVVLLEHGFAPHRVQESLFVLLGADERRRFADDHDDDARRAAADEVASRVLEFAGSNGPRSGEPRARTLWVPAPTQAKASHEHKRCEPADSTKQDKNDKTDCDDDDDTYLLRMSWPVMYEPAHAAHVPTLRVDTMPVTSWTQLHVGDAVLADFRSEQPAIVARTVARAAAKYAMTRSAKKSAGKHEALGSVIGALSNIGGALTEQADTRSWHLLPGTISIVRLHLPPGLHTLTIDGQELGKAMVSPGRVTVLSKRIWN